MASLVYERENSFAYIFIVHENSHATRVVALPVEELGTMSKITLERLPW